jgi:hypothetical protein
VHLGQGWAIIYVRGPSSVPRGVLGGSSTPLFSSIIFKIIKLDNVVDIKKKMRHLKITKVLENFGFWRTKRLI